MDKDVLLLIEIHNYFGEPGAYSALVLQPMTRSLLTGLEVRVRALR